MKVIEGTIAKSRPNGKTPSFRQHKLLEEPITRATRQVLKSSLSKFCKLTGRVRYSTLRTKGKELLDPVLREMDRKIDLSVSDKYDLRDNVLIPIKLFLEEKGIYFDFEEQGGTDRHFIIGDICNETLVCGYPLKVVKNTEMINAFPRGNPILLFDPGSRSRVYENGNVRFSEIVLFKDFCDNKAITDFYEFYVKGALGKDNRTINVLLLGMRIKPFFSSLSLKDIQALLPSFGMDSFRSLASKYCYPDFKKIQTALLVSLAFLNAGMGGVHPSKRRFFKTMRSNELLNTIHYQVARVVEMNELLRDNKRERDEVVLEKHAYLAKLAYGRMPLMEFSEQICDGAFFTLENKLGLSAMVSADIILDLAGIDERTPENFMLALETLLSTDANEIKEKARTLLNESFKEKYGKTFDGIAGRRLSTFSASTEVAEIFSALET